MTSSTTVSSGLILPAIGLNVHQKFPDMSALLAHVRLTQGHDPKGVCEPGKLPPPLAARVQAVIGLDARDFQLTLDSYGVRHAFAGHSQEWGSRDQNPLTEAGMLALPDWIFVPVALAAGAPARSAQPPLRWQPETSSELEQLMTVVIVEVRPRYRRLVLVTMFKRKNG